MTTLTRISGIIFFSLSCYISSAFTQDDLPPDIGKDFQYHRPEKPVVGRIAFTTTIGNTERIFVLDLQSGTVSPIITGPGNARYPTWSPDGRSIAFTSDRTGTPLLWRARWNGTGVRPANNKRELETGNASWEMKNGIYHYLTTPSGTNIFMSPGWRAAPRQITNFEGKNITPRLSPDKTLLAYTTDRFWPGWEVCLLNLKTNIENCPLRGTDSYCRPAWHKDSTYLLFSSGTGKNINIGQVNVKDGTIRMLTSLPNREYDPVWSPDYQAFAFVAEPEKLNHFQMFILFDGAQHPDPLLSSPYPIRYLAWDKHSTLKLEAERIRNWEEKKRQREKEQAAKRAAREAATPDPLTQDSNEEKTQTAETVEDSPASPAENSDEE